MLSEIKNNPIGNLTRVSKEFNAMTSKAIQLIKELRLITFFRALVTYKLKVTYVFLYSKSYGIS